MFVYKHLGFFFLKVLQDTCYYDIVEVGGNYQYIQCPDIQCKLTVSGNWESKIIYLCVTLIKQYIIISEFIIKRLLHIELMGVLFELGVWNVLFHYIYMSLHRLVLVFSRFIILKPFFVGFVC